MIELPPLPTPWDYCYEWRGLGLHRSFSANHWNGKACDDQVPIYTAEQMKAYATAAVLAERERCLAAMQAVEKCAAAIRAQGG